MKFFLDNNLSFRIARALNVLSEHEGDEVVALRDRFSPDVADVAWIPQLSTEGGWIIVSGDSNIRSKPAERQVFSRSKLTTFFLAKGWMNMTYWDQAYLLVRRWPQVRLEAQRLKPGSCLEIPHKAASAFRILT